MSERLAPSVPAAFVEDGALESISEHILAHAVVERLADTVMVFDRSWRFVYVNRRAEQLLRCERSALVGRVVSDVIPELDGSPFAQAYERAMARGEEVALTAWWGPHHAWYEVRALPTPAALVVLARDVTAEKTAEAERDAAFAREKEQRARAEEASRMKDEFLATLSHELRTPLNAIVGWAHMLQAGELSAVEQGRAVETVLRNARLQATLIEDLLDVSRIVTGKLALIQEPIAIGRAVVSAVESARPTASARGVALTVRVTEDCGEVLGDPARLQQVLWNLLSNALKFTPHGGHVEVRAAREEGEVVFEVADDGEGIDPAFLPHLFERFRQGDTSASRIHGGLGLGLAITRHVVEAHGGTVHAASEGAGRGTTFRVRLPAAAGIGLSSFDEEPPPVSGTRGALTGARVLVVDDEEDSRDLLAALLEHEGAEVRTAASAADAFVALAARPPHVLVCDIGMPVQDGYSFLRQLRAAGEASGGWVPAIALTGYARPEDSHAALLAGFQMHVTKPVEPSKLVSSIVRLWRRRRDGATSR